ncbi:MAG: nuclear transport factor 2 family protein [Anaerolineae bacterium]|nr:nuclear transport factor 2 family protein [Anaerolineae bacterium]
MMTEAAVEVAIRTAIMDYVEGWYESDVERMNRCLHPRLVKRTLRVQKDGGEPKFIDLTKEDMMGYTQAGEGLEAPRDKLYYKIDILDVYQETATARAETYEFIDYVQLVKQNGRWLIVNVLYTANHAAKK